MSGATARRRLLAVPVFLSIATAGFLAIQAGSAASFVVATEAEQGTPAGSAVALASQTASGGQAIRFGNTGQPAGRQFGTLVTDPDHAAEESANGIKLAMLEFWWQDYEPQNDQWNTSYINGIKQQIAAYKAAGMQITLAMGVHGPPGWVYNLPNSRFVNQSGQTSDDINVVFNNNVRAEVKEYYDRIHQDFGINTFNYIRLTSGGNAEMLYPDGNYWAFDTNAQNGAAMPPTMPRNPFPGWKPGQRTITTAQVGQWADWYVKALDDVAAWQMGVFNAQGFTGTYQMLSPGSGARASVYTSDINNYLPVPSITGVGAVWHKFYEFLPSKDRAMVYVSSVADHSGDDDLCAAGDAAVSPLSSQTNNWSATRWQTRLATQYGMPVGGENPGFSMPSDYDDFYVDTSDNGMMATALAQAKACNLKAFYWAHDEHLWNGRLSFSLYASRVAQTR
jgi:hypothetical protein